MKTIFISTGEVSGDLQGALLVTALRRLADKLGIDLEIVALGGRKMAAAGAKIIADTTGISSMGMWEALAYLRPSWQVRSLAKQYLKTTPPDVVILIDYIISNIELGNYISQQLTNIPIFYYIAPQEWVWSIGNKKSDAIVEFTNKIFAIFPGEAKYYADRGAKVKFVGHPLIDRVATLSSRDIARDKLGISDDEVAIALIPASRRQELKYLLPAIFGAAQQLQAKLPNVRFWIPLSRDEFRSEIECAIDSYQIKATLVTQNADLVLSAADLAITKCGTVSLELALLNIPQVVIYRVSRVTAWLAKNVFKFAIPYISPPNLVEMKSIVPELMQDDANPDRITAASLELIFDRECRDRMLADYRQMRMALGESGVCDRVAAEILAKL
ncbi:lipid-A-disaccharide synthase [Chamaesiphon sp. OTE_20_metabat_361]|uniref:lipid-A-disaccharide synthase n=1 Tax=Chamaesiphon sp. OTE_20_metabat_361 TaxID=2964689 RepID=UPI00286AA78F|nr:lipid-A-disaccharide synthase [Chamaesiphon sp. OTE_20_metabat_361]